MSSSVAKEWNAAAVCYFDPGGPSNHIQTNNVHDFIAEVSYMAQIIGPQATRENLQSCLRGLALSSCSHPVVQSYVASESGIEPWIATLLMYFDTDDTNKDWDCCLKKATAGYKCHVRGMEQQRIRKEQEVERQKAEQKARDEAFACRRCSAKFPSNTKLHVHHQTFKGICLLSNVAVPPVVYRHKLIDKNLHIILFD